MEVGTTSTGLRAFPLRHCLFVFCSPLENLVRNAGFGPAKKAARNATQEVATWQGGHIKLCIEKKNCELFNFQMPLYWLQRMSSRYISKQGETLQRVPARSRQVMSGWDNVYLQGYPESLTICLRLFCVLSEKTRQARAGFDNAQFLSRLWGEGKERGQQSDGWEKSLGGKQLFQVLPT